MIYRFSTPIKISYIIDDNELQILDINDLIELEEKYDVDLDYIIDEYEYKLETEENFLENEEDYFTINKNELLHTVINDNLNLIIDIFNNSYSLEKLTKEDITKILKYLSDDFNSKDYNFDDFNTKSIEIKEYNIAESKIIFHLDINEKLNNEQIKGIKQILDKLVFDNWVNEIENIDLSDVINENLMYVYLNFPVLECYFEGE